MRYEQNLVLGQYRKRKRSLQVTFENQDCVSFEEGDTEAKREEEKEGRGQAAREAGDQPHEASPGLQDPECHAQKDIQRYHGRVNEEENH